MFFLAGITETPCPAYSNAAFMSILSKFSMNPYLPLARLSYVAKTPSGVAARAKEGYFQILAALTSTLFSGIVFLVVRFTRFLL